MKPKTRKSVPIAPFAVLALIAVVMMLAAFASPVALAQDSTPISGDGVVPVLVDGNPDCGDLGYDNGFKIDAWDAASFPTGGTDPASYLDFFLINGSQNGYSTIVTSGPQDNVNTISIKSEDGRYVDWMSTLGLDAVIIKGGPDSNSYVYVPEDTDDTGLSTPGAAFEISHVEFCYDYELTASKTADAKYTRTYTWEIDKSVTPASHTGWFGDEFTSSYDVVVDQTVADSAFKVTGNITVNNPTPFEVNFNVSDKVNGTGAIVDCDGDPNNQVTINSATLAPGATRICTYVAELGESNPGDGTNVATINSTNANVQGATAEAPYAFGDPTTIEGFETINVFDYFDGDQVGEGLGSASGDYTFEYDRDFKCPTDEEAYEDGVYTDSFPNTAEIDETGQSDDANVDLTCYKPVVSKDADTEWFEKYEWTITKSVDPSSHTGFPGDQFSSDYDVVVDQTVTPYGYRAFGDISVFNPSGEQIVVDVADAVDGNTATVDCGAGSTSLTVPAGETKSCSYSVDLNDTTQLVNTATVTFNEIDFEATADVIFGDPTIVGFPTINITDYFDGDLVGEGLGSASGDYTFEYSRDFECPEYDENTYVNGVYTKSFPNDAEIDETGQSDDANVDLTCYDPAEAKVVKTTTEGPEDIGQFPLTFELYAPGLVPGTDTPTETKTLGTGGGTVYFGTELKATGTWTVKEVLPAGWVSTTDTECTFNVAFPGSAGQTYTCNFNNVEKSRVDLLKLTNGEPTTSQAWSFAIFEGPDGFGGTEVASDSTPPALLDFGPTDLSPFETYTICELGVPAGYSVFWQIDTDGDGVGDITVVPYNPNADDETPEDLGNRCVDFGANTNIPLTAGTTLHFVVDNQAPGGAPRTPGYWKNWNRCTNGGQQFTADANGGYAEGFWLLEDVLDPSIGGGIVWDDILTDEFLFPIDSCAVAVDLLDKREVGDPTVVGDGKKQASNAFFNLATHLLAAQLNFGAGACTTQEVLDAALAAETLLDKVDFNGVAGKNLPKKGNDATLANELATYLDQYNNGAFCGNGND